MKQYISFLLWITTVSLVQCTRILSHVERYDEMVPHRLHTRDKRSLLTDQLYPNVLGYEITIDGRNHTIHLEKNSHLLATSYTETHYLEDGSRVTTPGNRDHCYYHGHIQGMMQSSVSLDICRGITGFIRARQQVYLIEPLGASEDGVHAVYRPEDLRVSISNASRSSSSGSSSNSSEDYETDQDLGPRLSGLFKSKAWKRDLSPSSQRFVELIVVVDNAEYNRFGSKTRARVLGAVNHIDKLYRTLGIRIMLVGLEIWNYRDYIDMDPNSETTLDRFLLWRQRDLLKRIPHDNAQFVTGTDFEGDTVGLANKFAMCTGNSGGVNQDHHDNLIGLASTIAHEMGHNFGLSHDLPECTCKSSLIRGTCVMADKLRKGSLAFPEFFSSCSEEQLAEFMERAQPSCLSSPPNANTIAIGPRCGNAILDSGEECDCGTVEECRNPCCEPSTCRLALGSQCAHGECCNDSCQFKEAASVCRGPAGECDLAEHCTGLSERCPEDSFVMNGKPCYNQGSGYCHGGQCPTHSYHCWRLFGPDATVGSGGCFDLNREGRDEAHCGWSKYGFIPCTSSNVMCGSIFCEGNGDSITGKKALFNRQGRPPCLVVVDDEGARHLDMVPTGSRCGDNKVCINQQCVDTSVYGLEEECNRKCHNRGVCNHKKQCQCEPGWAPPYCEVQYVDLQPDQTALIVGLATAGAHLVLLAVIAVAVGLMCCKKNRKENYASKRKVHYTPGTLNPMFQEQVSKLQIGQPTFLETTATYACTPLFVTAVPCRPAPQPPLNSQGSTASQPQSSAEPPCRSLPPLNSKQNIPSNMIPTSALTMVKSGPSSVQPEESSPSPVSSSPPRVPSAKPSPPPAPSGKPSLSTFHPGKASARPVLPVNSSPSLARSNPPPVSPVKPSPSLVRSNPPTVPPVKPSPSLVRSSPPTVPPVKPSPSLVRSSPPTVPPVKPSPSLVRSSPPTVPSVKPSPSLVRSSPSLVRSSPPIVPPVKPSPSLVRSSPPTVPPVKPSPSLVRSSPSLVTSSPPTVPPVKPSPSLVRSSPPTVPSVKPSPCLVRSSPPTVPSVKPSPCLVRSSPPTVPPVKPSPSLVRPVKYSTGSPKPPVKPSSFKR